MNAALQAELDRRAEAACQFAAIGWPILQAHGMDRFGVCTCRNVRCDRPGKHPARSNYKRMATTDFELLRSYWRVIPFNLALLIPANMIVIDADEMAALDLLAHYRPWPVTPSAITSRGLHMFFLWPLKGDSPTIGGLDRIKLDVRGADELCTLAPSVSATGHRYAWRAGESPLDIPLAMLPATFAHHCRAVAARRRKMRAGAADDLTTLDGALRLARRRARYAGNVSNGVGRGGSGLARALTEAGAAPHVISSALDLFRAEAR